MWWTNSTWLNCLESLQVQAIRVREIFTGVFTFQLPTALESDLLFSHLPGSSLSEGRRAGRYLDRSTRMGENKHSRHQDEAEKDSRFGVICHCIVWHLWGGFTYMYWIHMDTMRTPCSPCTQESEPLDSVLQSPPQVSVSEPPPASVFVQRKLRSSLHGDGDCALHSILDSYNNLGAPCLREQHGGHHFWMNVWERSTSSLSHSTATLLMSKIGLSWQEKFQ